MPSAITADVKTSVGGRAESQNIVCSAKAKAGLLEIKS
jgi:hypothetical protein